MKDIINDVLGMLQCNFFPMSLWEREDVRIRSQNHDINSKLGLQQLCSLLMASGMEMFFACIFDVARGMGYNM